MRHRSYWSPTIVCLMALICGCMTLRNPSSVELRKVAKEELRQGMTPKEVNAALAKRGFKRGVLSINCGSMFASYENERSALGVTFGMADEDNNRHLQGWEILK